MGILKRALTVQQAAVLAVRQTGATAKVCLIRRSESSDWGIPKGFIDPGETAEEAALKEAWEEAGLTGQLIGPAIGTYAYRKWGLRLRVAVYVMKVAKEKSRWPEMDYRERHWSPIPEARSRLAHHPVRSLLGQVGSRLRKKEDRS